MTHAELNDILHEVGNDAVTPKEFREVCVALRAAWAERDALKAEVELLRMRCSDLKLALGDSAGWFDRFTSMRAERDARPDAATVAKVRVLLGCIETHSGLCATMRDLDCDCEHGEANDDAREALRLLEGKP